MRAALAFLTALGRPIAPGPSALAWFPVIGAALGLGLGAAWWVATQLWPPLLAAVVVVAIDLALTGGLHVDGLADSADGLLAPGLDRTRRLEVMAESSVGAYAVAVTTTTLLFRVAALAVLAPAPLLLASLWALSRTAMAVAARSVAYARPGGLASSFLGGPTAPVALSGGVLALALGATIGVAGLMAVVIAAGAAAAVVAVGVRRLGGFTGDVLGAAGIVAETAGLVVAAARW